jgi:hypothetical protein
MASVWDRSLRQSLDRIDREESRLQKAFRNCRLGNLEESPGLEQILRFLDVDETREVDPDSAYALEYDYRSSLDEVNKWGSKFAQARNEEWKPLFTDPDYDDD